MSNTNPFWKITSNQEVTVNEQNPQADEEGNPYPLLYMKRNIC